MNIFQDIKTAVKMTGEIRRAKKAGASAVQLRPVYRIPVVQFAPAYLNTIEGCLTWKLGQCVDDAVKKVFKGLPYETQRRLEFSPKGPGEWLARAQFWQQQLKPALPSEMYHDVMLLFIHWYVHCLRMEREALQA